MEEADCEYWYEHGLPCGPEEMFTNPLCVKPGDQRARPNVKLVAYMDGPLWPDSDSSGL